ncbi:MAG: hypothetical protein OXU32_08215 [Gammaproteobacteria bacterium]|nr:hypothetical protein [Gammaproteobacteria bacterium]
MSDSGRRAAPFRWLLAATLLVVCTFAMDPFGLVGQPVVGPLARSDVASHSVPMPAQPRDTLDVLLERVRSLETEVDALRAASDSAQVRYAALDSTLTQERRLFVEELAALRQSLIPLMDSVAAYTADAVRVELANGLRSIRSEYVRGREALMAQVEGTERSLDALEARLGSWEPEVRDSLTATAGRIQLERQERQAADGRSRFLLAIATGLLVVGIAVVWWSGRRRIAAVQQRVASPTTVDERIEEVRRELGVEVGREGQRLLEEQLKPLEGISRMLAKISDASGGAAPDHDLALGVCNEVNRIEKNLAAMDASVRGHRQLSGCVRRVKENLRVHRYDITELLGRDYDGGMHVEADFVEDEDLTPGRQVITRINRPEVRYADKIIQNASVKVSVGF